MTTPETLYNTARAYCDTNKLSIVNGKIRSWKVMEFARDVHSFPISGEYYKVMDKIEKYMETMRKDAEEKRQERIKLNLPQQRIF